MDAEASSLNPSVTTKKSLNGYVVLSLVALEGNIIALVHISLVTKAPSIRGLSGFDLQISCS